MTPWFSLFWLGWLLTVQDARPADIEDVAGAAFAPAGEQAGRITGIVFGPDGDAPLSGVTIQAQGAGMAVTDADGAFTLDLPQGDHVLTYTAPSGTTGTTDAVPVTRGQVTEVLITLPGPGAAPVVSIEASAPGGGFAMDVAEDLITAVVQGMVVHLEKQTPVVDARVFVRGYPLEGRTDEDGKFAMDVPVGTQQITVVHPEFSTFTQPDVEVTEGQVTEIFVQMTPAAVQLEDFVVSVPHIEGGTVALLEERKESGNVVDVIGAEQMAKSGDSDAAGALKRVTGVTVVGGKYVFVRGLGERYSSTLLNGSTLPSPEPERRVVPLDMFPADLLESLVIQKTFSPDMPAEFGGGSVQIRTKSFPDQFTAKLSFSAGFVLGTTFYKGLMYDGGKTDWLGIDDGTRELPAVVEAASSESSLRPCNMFVTEGCFTPQQLEKLGESMPSTYDTHRKTVPPDLGFSVTLGDSFDIKSAVAGYLVSFVYKNDWDISEEHHIYTKLGDDDEVVPQHTYDFESLANKITMAGILTFGVDFSEHHKVKLVSLLDRITDNEARIYQGFNNDLGGDLRVTRLRWIERMLFAQQVQGLHVFPEAMDLQLDWRYTFSLATRLEPDRREYRKDLEEADEEDEVDLWILSDRPEGNQRFFSELMDMNHDVSLDLTLPFLQWSGEEARAMVGFTSVIKDREVDTRRYHYTLGSSVPTEVLASSPELIFSPEWIGAGSGMVNFEEYTRSTDNYLADQLILAGYTLVDLPLGAGFRLLSGVRFEFSDQNVKTFELFNPEAEPVTASLATKDWLPALAFTWALPKGHQLRLGFSRTVSRPDFRELSPATFNDVTGGRQVFGNADLNRALLTNVDLRWEWYIAPGESLSVGLFYKNFQDPIEQVVKVAAQHTVTWENAKGANNFGLEVEFRKSFDFIADALRDLYVAFNGTLIYSRIQLRDTEGSIQTSQNRPLQGQSPWVFNLQLGYDNVDWGTTLVLLYNVFGKRISDVGARGAPDVYEQPFHQLDFVFRQKLAHGFALGFKARNILDLPVEFHQCDITVLKYRKGRSLSVSVSKTF